MLIHSKPKKLLKPFVITIPSYKRPEQITTKTLKLLSNSNLATNIPIYIFVADEIEYNNYQESVAKANLRIQQQIKYVIGVPGLVAQRNYIIDWFAEKQQIVSMDDDVEQLYRLETSGHNDYKSRKLWKLIKTERTLQNIIEQGFAELKQRNAYLWGIYPIDNQYFMTPKITEDLRFIVGPLYGIINRTDMKLTTPAKDNVERTLMHYKRDGKIIRFNNITIHTKYYKNKGGLQNVDIGPERKTKAESAAKYLHGKYPEYTDIIYTKKNKWPELKLTNKTKRVRH